MKIAFTGTQQGMSANQLDELRALLRGHKPKIAIHGDCIGGDAQFHDVVREECPDALVWIFPSNIDAKSAHKIGDLIELQSPPLRRNHSMVDECDLLVAGPKTLEEVLRSGTWATIRYARKTHKKVTMLRPEVSPIEQLLG